MATFCYAILNCFILVQLFTTRHVTRVIHTVISLTSKLFLLYLWLIYSPFANYLKNCLMLVIRVEKSWTKVNIENAECTERRVLPLFLKRFSSKRRGGGVLNAASLIKPDAGKHSVLTRDSCETFPKVCSGLDSYADVLKRFMVWWNQASLRQLISGW